MKKRRKIRNRALFPQIRQSSSTVGWVVIVILEFMYPTYRVSEYRERKSSCWPAISSSAIRLDVEADDD